MLLAFAGVTGIGKSYYKDKLVQELGFEKVKIITTREIRVGEKNNDDKIFVTPKELQILRDSGKIAYEFDMLGNTYAYTKNSLFSNHNTVFELHYSTIADLKKICPHLRVIYLFPQDIEVAKDKTRQRHLKPEVEAQRLIEIDEHYHKMITDETLRNMFDYILYNDYSQVSDKVILDLVRKLMLEEKWIHRGI